MWIETERETEDTKTGTWWQRSRRIRSVFQQAPLTVLDLRVQRDGQHGLVEVGGGRGAAVGEGRRRHRRVDRAATRRAPVLRVKRAVRAVRRGFAIARAERGERARHQRRDLRREKVETKGPALSIAECSFGCGFFLERSGQMENCIEGEENELA